MHGPIYAALLLVVALSTDALVSGFAYGAGNARIPFAAATVVSAVCTAFLAASLLIGRRVRAEISETLAMAASIAILVALGLFKLFDCIIKKKAKQGPHRSKSTQFSVGGLRFVLTVYVDPIHADNDCSKALSVRESVPLAAALSLDGLAVGMGSGMTDVSIPFAILFSLMFTYAALAAGRLLGNRFAGIASFDLSWVGGLIAMKTLSRSCDLCIRNKPVVIAGKPGYERSPAMSSRNSSGAFGRPP